MSLNQLFIGIDSGTPGTKVVMLSRDRGQIISSATALHPILETLQGGREQHPEWWPVACEQAIHAVLQAPAVDCTKIKAIVVSGQQRSPVALDAQMKRIMAGLRSGIDRPVRADPAVGAIWV